MAHTNTIYYLNSQNEFDNEILMSPCSMVIDDEVEANSNKMSLSCFVKPLKHTTSAQSRKYIYSATRQRDMQCILEFYTDMSPDTFSSVSLDISPFSEIFVDILSNIAYQNGKSNYVRSSSMGSNLEASALRERLIYGIWWKEFGIMENDIIESISINENGKILCRGVITLSKNQRNIYLIGDICFKPYLRKRLIAIIDFVSNYVFCQKMFIRIKKASPGFKTLVGNLLWVGFQVVPSTFLSSQSYLLLSIDIQPS
ncbi:uncharacterized protein T551_01231 [Pneumocystis jirovecii RU7]|uniref:Uncharacterized protein n=1 Tax=Pneumocystis jirovecii (strain RU7) TaxID=1408657 RepID=A0A0W4ZS04_PNEJ7|nr:uncharacterized protein T551_01231 [Pneumocystis jirovecii RU7]KTW31158.1 hypothetical protein T551_01231 [Pneumocystis jirovecii RU7]